MAGHRGRNLLLPQVSLTVLFLLLSVNTSNAFFGDWGPDLAGPWCARRGPGSDCCVGRDDICAVPILGTECYCDIFCNETAYDCCPDYWSHCHGINKPTTTPRPTTLPPPRTTRMIQPCYRDGVTYRPGESVMDNCQKCTCELVRFTDDRYDWKCSNDVCLVRPEMIERINEGRYTWKSRNYSMFWGMTLAEGVRFRLGTFLLQGKVLRMTPIRVMEDDSLPESFDARRKWPNMIQSIRDQGNCASSWAHSTTAVASDRLSIETNGAIQDELSAQHMLSCNVKGQKGCEGGNLDRAWWFLRKTGVVNEKCYPYISGKTESIGQCLWPTSKKSGVCPSGAEYKGSRRYKATPPYRIRPLEREIMKEVMDNGPVQATFQVREDFFVYSGGIYSYSSLTTRQGESEQFIKSGFHSVRIIGWGAERTFEGDIIKYWLCANSWGPQWGENGYFRILRGVDESRIERYVVGVWGKISGDSILRAVLQDNRRQRLRGQRNQRQVRNLQTRRRRRHNRSRRHNRRSRQDKKKLSKKSEKSRRYEQENKKSLNVLRRLYNNSTSSNSNSRLNSLEDFFPGLSH